MQGKCPNLSGISSVLVLKIANPGKSMSPGQTETVLLCKTKIVSKNLHCGKENKVNTPIIKEHE